MRTPPTAPYRPFATNPTSGADHSRLPYGPRRILANLRFVGEHRHMDNELYKDRLTWFTVIWALVCPIKFLVPSTIWAPADTTKDRTIAATVIRALLSPIRLLLSDDAPWIWACIMVVSG